MPGYLLDTDILSHLLRFPHGPAARRLASTPPEDCFTSLAVAAEMRTGAAKRGSRRLSGLVDGLLRRIEIRPLETPADRHYAAIRATLERQGTPIGANDLWIAAHALALGAVLVTANECEFRRVPSLQVETWREG